MSGISLNCCISPSRGHGIASSTSMSSGACPSARSSPFLSGRDFFFKFQASVFGSRILGGPPTEILCHFLPARYPLGVVWSGQGLLVGSPWRGDYLHHSHHYGCSCLVCVWVYTRGVGVGGWWWVLLSCPLHQAQGWSVRSLELVMDLPLHHWHPLEGHLHRPTRASFHSHSICMVKWVCLPQWSILWTMAWYRVCLPLPSGMLPSCYW